MRSLKVFYNTDDYLECYIFIGRKRLLTNVNYLSNLLVIDGNVKFF